MKTASSDSNLDNVKKLGELIKDVKVAMLTTIGADQEIHSCPMMTQQVDFDGDLWFMTKRSSNLISNIQAESHVSAIYASPSDQLYVSVAGQAEMVTDRAKIDELWTSAHKVWFEGGKDDPEIALIRVQVQNAEYWDAPSSAVVRMAIYAKAMVTGQTPPKIGEHQKLDIH